MEFFIEFQINSTDQVEEYGALVKLLGKIRSGVSIVFPEQLADLNLKLSGSQLESVVNFCRTYAEFLSCIETFQTTEQEMKLTIVGGWDTPDACRDLERLLEQLGVTRYELDVSH